MSATYCWWYAALMEDVEIPRIARRSGDCHRRASPHESGCHVLNSMIVVVLEESVATEPGNPAETARDGKAGASLAAFRRDFHATPRIAPPLHRESSFAKTHFSVPLLIQMLSTLLVKAASSLNLRSERTPGRDSGPVECSRLAQTSGPGLQLVDSD